LRANSGIQLRYIFADGLFIEIAAVGSVSLTMMDAESLNS